MKQTLFYTLAGIVYIVLVFKLPDVVDISPLWIAIALMVVYCSAIYLMDKYVFSVSTVADLEKKVMKKMNEEGYQCKKNEGVLMYIMKGRVFDSYFWHIDKNFFRTTIVERANIDDRWDRISVEGKAVLANYVNDECNHTTFIATERGCVCMHTVYVRNASDFLSEAKNACDVMGRAFYTAVDIFPQIKERYSVVGNESNVGFVRREEEKAAGSL